MKQLKLLALAIPLMLILALGGAVVAFNAGLFSEYIQKEAQKTLGPEAKVVLGPMKLAYRWPPFVRVSNSVIDLPTVNLQWHSLEVELIQIFAPYSVALNFYQPHVIIKTPTHATPPPQAAANYPAETSKPTPVAVRLQVVDGEIKSDYGTLSKLNMKFEQKLLMKTPAAVNLTANVQPKFLPVDLPLRVATDKLTFSAEAVKTSDLKVTLGGLNASVQGTSLLSEGRHRWLIEVVAKDLGALPEPPMENMPAKKWHGEVELKAEVAKESKAKPWTSEGHFLAKDVGADLDYKGSGATVKGPFRFEADGQYSYLGDRASLPNLKASLDLSSASVEYEEWLKKAAGVPMKVSLLAGGDEQKVNLRELTFTLSNFEGQVTGAAELKAPYPGDLNFVLKPANLAGSERLFPPLGAQPVAGEIAVKGSVHGPLADYMKTRVVIDQLSLKKFAAVVNLERDTLKLRGPITADVQGQGEFSNGAVKSAAGKGFVNLSEAALVAGPLRKENREDFRVKFAVRNAGSAILVDEMDLTSFIGNFGAKGKVDMATAPALDLTITASPANLSEMRVAMPSFRELLPKGSVTTNLKLNGKLEMSRPWHEWDVATVGSVSARLPEYKLISAASAAATAPSAKAPLPAPATSFLPDGPLTRKARINIKAQIDEFVKDDLKAKNVTADGVYGGGKYIGSVAVGQVFGGSAQVKNLNVPMLQAKPKISGHVDWLNISLEEALAFAKPEYKGFAVGRSAGLADFTTVLPAEADFMQQLKARGDLGANPVVLNSVKVGEMVNAQIAKVPQLKLKPMKVDPLRGQAKMQFDLNNGVADIANFEGVDVDNSEIQMKGKVVLASMEGDFVGAFYWSDPPVKGCALEGNADAKGRLIVPLAIKGNLLRPGVNVLSDVIGKLAVKAVECEGKKLVEKAKVEGQKAIEKEVKKKLQNLFGK